MAPILSINRWLLTVLAALSLTASALVAADTATAVPPGTIRGKVMNASNGANLENAIVTIAGTNRQETTNSFGEYEFTNVPAGNITLVAKYVGEPDIKATATVLGGAGIEQNFTFRETAETIRTKDGAIVLDPFLVSAERYKNAAAIAIAVERASVNIKNVVSTDAFGDIPSGNVGEFVKFIPGVQVSYGSFGGNNQGYADNEASGISIRGFGPEDTAILIDGMPVSNATPGSLSRQVGLDQLSINNAARIEIVKVSTSDMPANSIGGQVNLVTKSAFEFAKPSYSGRVFFNFNSLHTGLGKTPGPVDHKTYKTTPGVEFSISYPFSKTLGLSFTGSASDEFKQSYRAAPVYTIAGTVVNSAGNVVSLTNPMLSRFQITDDAMMVEHRSANLHLDWRPSPSQLIRANVQYSTYKGQEAQRKLDAKPSIVSGVDWDANKTVGFVSSTVNGAVDMTVTTRDKLGDTKSAQVQYELKKGGWNVSAAASTSISTGDYQDRANNHFSELGMKLNPGRVILDNITDGIPMAVRTYSKLSAGGGTRDYTALSNWGFDGTIAKSGEALSKNTVSLFKVDVERDLSFLKFIGANSLTVKVGGRRDIDKTEKSGLGTNYREILRPGASYTVTDILDTDYLGQTPGFGYPSQEWGSTYALYEIEQAKDIFYVPDFDESTNTRVENYNSYVGQQKSITDTKDGVYGLLAGSFLKNRLSFNFGVRQESSARNGRGPFTDSKWNYIKNKSGTLYQDAFYKAGVKFDGANNTRTNADGTTTTGVSFLTDPALLTRLTAAGIKYPDHIYGPSASSVESRMLQLIPLRQVQSKINGKPSYSLSTSFQLTKKIDLKASWSRSFGLPSLEDATNGLVSGNNTFSINETIPEVATQPKGNISVANPNIKPSTSQNLDFEVSYYTDTGGKLAVSYYMKDVTDQIVTTATDSKNPIFFEILPILGLDPAEYQKWVLKTSTNATSIQKTSGYEFEVRQNFAFLGHWGKNVSAFASYAVKTLGDVPTLAPIVLFAPDGITPISTPITLKTITRTSNRFGGAGLQYSGRRLTAQVRGTYKNENEIKRDNLPNGNYLRRFEPEEVRVDITVNYSLNKTYNLFVSGRDVFNASRKQIQKDDLGLLPAYAQTVDYREFGVSWTVGINGKF